MSLINDALKRASKTQQEQRSTSVPPLTKDAEFIPAPARAPIKDGFPVAALVIIFIAVFAGGIWFFWQWSHGKKEEPKTVAVTAPIQQAQPTPVAVKPVQSKPVSTPPQAVVAVTPKSSVKTNSPLLAKPVEKQPAPIVLTSPKHVDEPRPKAAQPVVEKVELVASKASVTMFPTLKLQGIFFRLSNPSAMIDGKQVFVGEKVQGAKVIKIERQSVTLEFDGQTKELSLQ